MSLLLQPPDESVERDLFERRARACSAAALPAGVPSLDAVLRAARVPSREAPAGRWRTLQGLALAAACVLTVVKTCPRDRRPVADGIEPDVVGPASASFDAAAGLCEVPAYTACTPTEPRPAPESVASLAPPLAAAGGVCSAPPATFAVTSSASSRVEPSCRLDEPLASILR